MTKNWIGLVVLFSVVNFSLAGYCRGDILKGDTFTATCEYNGSSVSCEGLLKPGTQARITCQRGYKKINRIVQEVLSCDDFGKWDYSPFRCEPICGVENVESAPLILGGARPELNVVPWHAAIYMARQNGYEHICGGTIINAKVIVSAAHCFWLEDSNKIVNNSLLTVAVGKLYQKISAEEPFPVQYLNVSNIHVLITYPWNRLTGHHMNDIAILVLGNKIQFGSNVRPICLQWFNYHEKYMSSGIVGRLVGWRSTGTELARNEVRMATVSYHDCRNAVESQFRHFVSADKFCVASPDGGMPCQGDAGAGFVVPKDIDGVKTYFLAGVVSTALTNGGQCPGNYTTLTNIQFYQSIIIYHP